MGGSLNYALSVDAGAVFAIGNIVTATITPVSSGLVKATILSCEVTNSDLASDNEVSIIDVVENQELPCSISLAKEPAAVSPQTCGSSGGTVTYTEMTGKTCTITRQPRVRQFGVTADECETQCSQDSECVAFVTVSSQCQILIECNAQQAYSPTAVLKIKD